MEKISNTPQENTIEEIQSFSIENLVPLLEKMREQINDEYEYGVLVQVFGGGSRYQNGKLFLLKKGEEIRGIAVADIKNQKEGTLEAVYVPKKYRMSGIAKQLTEKRMQYFIENDIEKVNINITSAGARTIAEQLRKQYGDMMNIKDHGDYF